MWGWTRVLKSLFITFSFLCRTRFQSFVLTWQLRYYCTRRYSALQHLLLAPAEGWWPSATWRALQMPPSTIPPMHLPTHLVLLDLFKTFFKSPRGRHECSPIYGLCFVYLDFLNLFIKRVFWGSKISLSRVSSSFWPFWPSKWQNLLSYNTFKYHFWKLEAMMDLHILLDPVTDFWICFQCWKLLA